MPSPSLVFRPRSCLHILAGKLYYHDFNYPLWINDSKSMSSSFNSVLSCRPVCSTALQTVSLGMLTGTLTQTRLNRLALPALGTFSLFTPVLEEPCWLRDGKPSPHTASHSPPTTESSVGNPILAWLPPLHPRTCPLLHISPRYFLLSTSSVIAVYSNWSPVFPFVLSPVPFWRPTHFFQDADLAMWFLFFCGPHCYGACPGAWIRHTGFYLVPGAALATTALNTHLLCHWSNPFIFVFTPCPHSISPITCLSPHPLHSVHLDQSACLLLLRPVLFELRDLFIPVQC